MYVAQRTGQVRVVRNGRLLADPILDLSSDILDHGGPTGLLGMAISPLGSDLYLTYTDTSGSVRLVGYRFEGQAIDPTSRRDLLRLPMPHVGEDSGGNLAFGPDGDLWLGLGDGNFKDPLDEAQSLQSLQGKLLRVDPIPTIGRPYGIPNDNPFVAVTGAKPEIYAYGLRHPWRFSFDRETGDLWIGDVGEYRREEIDYLPAGQGAGTNFGWNRLEGTSPFSGAPPPDAVGPLFEYAHDSKRCAVIGGYVYRGSRIPDLRGVYVYSDWCESELRALVQKDGHVVATGFLGPQLANLASFGEGPDGELYALSQAGVFRLDPS